MNRNRAHTTSWIGLAHLFTFTVALSVGCDKIDIRFSVDQAFGAATISAGTLPSGSSGTLHLYTNIDLRSQSSEFAKNVNRLKRANVTSLSLTIDGTSTCPNFNFITDATIRISATIDGSLQSTIIGTLPAGTDFTQTTLNVTMSGADIAPYLKASSFTIEITANFPAGTNPPSELVFTANARYQVVANP